MQHDKAKYSDFLVLGMMQGPLIVITVFKHIKGGDFGSAWEQCIALDLLQVHMKHSA